MCEYCSKKIRNDKICDIDNDELDKAEIIFLREPYLNVELDATDNDGYKANEFFRIYYCPMCGRKLGDK